MVTDSFSQPRSTYKCFLSMPHEYTDLRVAIEEHLKSLERFDVQCIYVTRSEGKMLRDEVTEKIKTCDFIIGDVSSGSSKFKGPRPNILWELGYTWHMGLERIIIVNKKETSNVSSLIIDQHYISYDPNKKKTLLNQIVTAVDAVCSRVETTRTKQQAENVYSAKVYVNRVEINLPNYIQNAKKNIRILETNLESVASELVEHLANSLNDSKRLHLTVQICTLNPHSKFAEARALQLARLKKDYEKELIESLHRTYNKLKDCNKDRWEIKIYDTFPTQITFSFDETEVFSSVMALGKRSRQMLHFQVQPSNRNAYDTFVAHFNQLYGSAFSYEEWLAKEREIVLIKKGSTKRQSKHASKLASSNIRQRKEYV